MQRRMNKEILCTLGPSSFEDGVIARLERLGVTLFRINLSHTPTEEIERVIARVQRVTEVPLCLDTEGAQIRTGRLRGGTVELVENAVVTAHGEPREGDAENFSLYPDGIVARLEPGDIISIDFDTVLVQVIAAERDYVRLRVLNGGRIGSNKAVTVLNRILELPPLTEKDRHALRVGAEMGVLTAALSFANHAEDVETLRRAFRRDGFVISKIECRNGVRHLDGIVDASDAVLIDRGDLSREFAIEQIPALQKHIIARCKARRRPVYVATNLLESMVSSATPTRAEINDIYNTLVDGADGLVLAAETAIGRDPVRCADMIVRMIREFEADRHADGTMDSADAISALVAPHGGTLVSREAQPDDLDGIEQWPSLTLSDHDLIDCEQLALGTYSPLAGFMTREELDAVLDEMTLPGGVVWTMPLILQIPADALRSIGVGDRVVLRSGAGEPHALLDVSEIYAIDLDKTARRWFGTDRPDHPGVARLTARGTTVVAGGVTLLRAAPYRRRTFALGPADTRLLFNHKGWRRVVGFHGRDVANRRDEYIQLTALARTHADGLYINPTIGPGLAGEFLADPILESYQLLIDQGVYSPNTVVLGSLPGYPRHAGPRETVFAALCRKNMGCSHFVVAEDSPHSADAVRRLFDELGDIGITPVFFDGLAYNVVARQFEVPGRRKDETAAFEPATSARLREALRAGKSPPDWLVRPAVQDMLSAHIAAGRALFHA